MTCPMVRWKPLQKGHSKSENSITFTEASGLPMTWSSPLTGLTAPAAARRLSSSACCCWTWSLCTDSRITSGWLRRYSRTISSISLLRSEEHTSELQSLMRISYAVFCLKKKKIDNHKKTKRLIQQTNITKSRKIQQIHNSYK